MAVFRAFKALRPTKEKAAAVAALPYDVVNREEAAAIGKENPDSFLHVDRAEMDLPEDCEDPEIQILPGHVCSYGHQWPHENQPHSLSL